MTTAFKVTNIHKMVAIALFGSAFSHTALADDEGIEKIVVSGQKITCWLSMAKLWCVRHG